MTINHFWAMALFAFAVSVAFAFLTKQTARERFQYFSWAFVTFLVVAIGLGWLMYLFSH